MCISLEKDVRTPTGKRPIYLHFTPFPRLMGAPLSVCADQLTRAQARPGLRDSDQQARMCVADTTSCILSTAKVRSSVLPGAVQGPLSKHTSGQGGGVRSS